MANWCSNKLTIDGEHNEICKFLKSFWNDSMRSFKMSSIIGDSTQWGTFGYDIDCSDTLSEKMSELNISRNYLEINYNTAFTPNTYFITDVSKIYNGLTFTLNHYEDGAGYIGTMSVKNGDILEVNEVIRSKDLTNEKEFYELVLDLNFETIDNLFKRQNITSDTLNYLRNRIINGKNVIDVTDFIRNKKLYPEIT